VVRLAERSSNRPYAAAMVELIARLVAPSAPLAAEEVAIGITATARGAVGVLATTQSEVVCGYVRGPHGNRMHHYEPPRSSPAVLLRYEAGKWSRVKLVYLPVSHPSIALLPDGEVLVVSSSKLWTGKGWDRRNAHVFGPDGAHRRALALGHKIEEVVVDDAGMIWTTHSEEGWSDVGHCGLIRRDSDGNRLWDSGLACYDTAVNPTRDIAWAYRWPRLLIRVCNGVTEEYDSPLHSVSAIAFDDDRLLLAGPVEPGDPGDELSWCVLVDGAVQRRDAARIIGPQGKPLEDWAILASHGSRLYFQDYGDGYYGVDIADNHARTSTADGH
jgi:hypothetical protein